MSGSFNALQITDPNASDNMLTQGTPSLGEAAYTSVSQLDQWLAAQRAKSQQMGLWTGGSIFEGGHPTAAGVADIGSQYTNALLMGTTAPGAKGITAYHGSPYDFERFDASKIGTGEGAQAYGHGLYFAEKEGTAQSYRDQVSGRAYRNNVAITDPTAAENLAIAHSGDVDAAMATLKTRAEDWSPAQKDRIGYDQTMQDLEGMRGQVRVPAGTPKMYQVNIAADPEQFLHWDQTVSQHPDAVRNKLLDMGYGDTDTGATVYSHMARGKDGDAGASQRLLDAGIPGIRYLDQGSRSAGEGSRNTVVFDANTIDILRKYGIAGLGLGLSAAAATDGSQQPPMAQ